MTASLDCLTLPHSNLHKYTAAGTMHKQNMVSDAAHGPNVGGRKKEEEEGGVTGLILQPLDDDLRSGRGIELDPSPATKKWKEK